jgi:hypothetical protein
MKTTPGIYRSSLRVGSGILVMMCIAFLHHDALAVANAAPVQRSRAATGERVRPAKISLTTTLKISFSSNGQERIHMKTEVTRDGNTVLEVIVPPVACTFGVYLDDKRINPAKLPLTIANGPHVFDIVVADPACNVRPQRVMFNVPAVSSIETNAARKQ